MLYDVTIWIFSLDFQHPTKKLQCVCFSQFQDKYHRYSKLILEAWVTWFYPRTAKVLEDIIYLGYQNYLRPGMFWLESAVSRCWLISCLLPLEYHFVEGSFDILRWIDWSFWFCFHLFRLPMLLVLCSCGSHPAWLVLKHIYLL